MSDYKDIFANLLVKTHFTEEKDEREYDYEGDMAKSQLKSIITNAQKLHDMLDDSTNLPEWVQSKITLAEDYVLTAANYMEGELDEEYEMYEAHMTDAQMKRREELVKGMKSADWEKRRTGMVESAFDIDTTGYTKNDMSAINHERNQIKKIHGKLLKTPGFVRKVSDEKSQLRLAGKVFNHMKRGQTFDSALVLAHKQGVAEGSEDSFKASHNDAVEQAKSEHGDPAKHEYKFDNMSGRHGAHNSYLHYPDKKVTVNTQMYKSGPAHNVFVSRGKQGVAEGYKDGRGGYKKFSGSGSAKQPLLGKEGSKRKAHIRDIVQSLHSMDASKPISGDHHAKILKKLERLKEEAEQVDEQSPAEIKAKYYHDQFNKVKPVKAYDKEGKLVGRYRSMDHAKQMKPGHTYKVEEGVELDEANMRFDYEAAARPKSSDVKNFLNRDKNPRAAAASKKYIRRMTKLGGLGPNQTKKDTEAHMKAHFEEVALDEMDKSQPSSSRGAEGLALGKKADPVKTDKVKSDALKLLQKQYKKVKEEVEQIDELKKSTLASYVNKAANQVRAKSGIAASFETQGARKRNPENKTAYWGVAQDYRKGARKRLTGIEKATAKLAKEEVETVEEGAADWKKAFDKKSKSNLQKDTWGMKLASKHTLMSKSHFDNKDDVKHAVDQIKRDKTIKVDEEVRYFSGTTVSGKPWKFIPPGEPKMLSPEFVKDRVPTLTDKEAHEVAVVAKDQYNDVEKKFAEMSEAKGGTVPKTAKEKDLAAKAHPKHLITRKDVLHARGVKLGEEELREKMREKMFAGKTMTKKQADPVVFHPMGKKKQPQK